MYNRNKKLHRNSQKRFYNSDYFYFITTVTFKRFPFFKEELFCRLLIDNLLNCKNIKKFKLFAFTILSDHVHLLIKPNEQ
ncbi:MAG: transposase, partial [Candidatus Falkowbacteria bacterium]|nr:transposase [Candidatus Falkowbacteria bacterium]